MRMRDGLPRSFADIDADVVTIGQTILLNYSSDRIHQGPDSSLLLHGHVQKIFNVSSRNYQYMTRTDRISILYGSRQFIPDYDFRSGNSCAKGTFNHLNYLSVEVRTVPPGVSPARCIGIKSAFFRITLLGLKFVAGRWILSPFFLSLGTENCSIGLKSRSPLSVSLRHICWISRH